MVGSSGAVELAPQGARDSAQPELVRTRIAQLPKVSSAKFSVRMAVTRISDAWYGGCLGFNRLALDHDEASYLEISFVRPQRD